MKYRYVYKTGDGIRHEAEIEAGSRDKAFERLRSEGIRPIKVVATDGSKANGEVRVLGVPRKVLFAAVLTAAALATALTWMAVGYGRMQSVSLQDARLPQRVKLRRVAMPLPRQEIRGSRRRLEIAPTNLFATAVEIYLSKFAEPGRKVSDIGIPADNSMNVEELLAVLDAPIHFADDEYTEFVDLKRITAGIKREMAEFIRGGGTVAEYLAELSERQKVEVAHRATAEKRLEETISTGSDRAGAYDYWLKANARLQSMGIYPIPLPDALRDHQFDLDLDE